MSHSQFHCTGRVYLDLHGLIFETSICYWQDQPGSPRDRPAAGTPARPTPWGERVGADPPDASSRLSPGLRRGGPQRSGFGFPAPPRETRLRRAPLGVWPAFGRPGGASGVGFEKHGASGGHRRIAGSTTAGGGGVPR